MGNYSLILFTGFLLHCIKLWSYPSYQEFPNQLLIAEGSYLNFVNKIDKDSVKSIFEIGSRDAKDACQLSHFFKCHVFAFECNPVAIEICKHNIDTNPNITLLPLAIWNRSGPMSFYRVIAGNIGASSCFKFNPEARNYPDIVAEGLVQEEIIVNAIRLDEFLEINDIDSIDLLCMDVQGAAFEVLDSLGKYLEKVKYIIVELETHPIYKGEVLYDDIEEYLTYRGFQRASNALDKDGLFGDVLYINLTRN